MSDEEKDEELAILVETRDERLAREEQERQNAIDDAEFVRQVAEEAMAAAKKNPTPLDKPLPFNDAPIHPVASLGSNNLPTTVIDEKGGGIRDIPQDIKMEFVSDDELEDMEEWDLMGPTTKNKP